MTVGGPLIGIAVGRVSVDTRIGPMRIEGTPTTYVHAVRDAGGLPVMLSSELGAQRASGLLDRLDGLVISGGGDVDPGVYGEVRSERCTFVNRTRDEFELALLREASRREFPTLAICRGMQVLNVLHGGNLVQDMDPAHPRTPHLDAAATGAHDVHVAPDSQLARITGAVDLPTNSFHHQAVDRLGAGLQVTARSADGTIEGLEIAGREHLVGVQWHPEHMTAMPEHAALFRWVVERAERAAVARV